MNDTVKLRMQHSSLQFSDRPSRQKQDIRDLFTLGEGYPVKTGTEAGKDAGDSMNREWVEEFAEKFNHIVHFAADNWIAVDRDIIKRGTVDRGSVFLADNDEMVGMGHDRIMATMRWEHVTPGVGVINLGALHYPTKGKFPGDVNYELNKRIARKVHNWLLEVAVGPDLGFVNGDFNMPDDKTDWAFGGNFTSIADELRAWQNTGHGPIDGFASFDRDGRVTAHRFNVLDDREFFQFSDHFVCRGVWEIRKLQLKTC